MSEVPIDDMDISMLNKKRLFRLADACDLGVEVQKTLDLVRDTDEDEQASLRRIRFGN